MKALMRTEQGGEFIEVVDVKSGPHRMVFDGEGFRAAPDDAESIVDVYAITRTDGTPWLAPADMIQFVE